MKKVIIIIILLVGIFLTSSIKHFNISKIEEFENNEIVNMVNEDEGNEIVLEETKIEEVTKEPITTKEQKKTSITTTSNNKNTTTSTTKKQEPTKQVKEEKNNTTNTTSQKVVTEVKKENSWDKLGMTENEYYNEPLFKWEHVDFPVTKYGNEAEATKACINYGDSYPDYLDGKVLYHCSTVSSASGKYLGEMFHTENLN